MEASDLLENTVKASFYLAGFFSLFLGVGWTFTGLPRNTVLQNLHSGIPLPGGLLTLLTIIGLTVIFLGIYNYRENEDSVFGKIVGVVAELLAAAP